MLGELIGEETGKISSVRVLPFDGIGPRMEVSFQGSGKLVGHEMEMEIIREAEIPLLCRFVLYSQRKTFRFDAACVVANLCIAE